MFNKWKKAYFDLKENMEELEEKAVKWDIEDDHVVQHHKISTGMYSVPFREAQQEFEKEIDFIISKFSKRPVKLSRGRNYYNLVENNALKFFESRLKRIHSLLEESVDRIETEMKKNEQLVHENEVLKEALDQYVLAAGELDEENQELREEVLRLRYFKNVHSEGDK